MNTFSLIGRIASPHRLNPRYQKHYYRRIEYILAASDACTMPGAVLDLNVS